MSNPVDPCKGIIALENAKFRENDSGDICVEICATDDIPVSGEFSLSGLNIGGLVTEVALNSATWTALPATALTNRNGMGFQNPNGIEIKINFATPGSFVGWSIKPNGEFFIDVSDAITIYAKSASGTPTVVVMEVA